MSGLAENLRDLPALLSGHLLLSLCALATAAALTLILAVAADRSERVKRISLNLAGTMVTIPSLALLAMMVPLLGGTIGFAPAYAALTLYAVLPMLQNTIAGLDAVAPSLIEAARGLGMSERQILRRVRFPLALPVIVAGLRTAAVWTIGTTTLATAVGASGLGTYIFTGLQTRNHGMMLFGCFFAAALAISLDQTLSLLESALQTRRRGAARLVTAALGAAALLAVAAASPPLFNSEQKRAAAAAAPPPPAGSAARAAPQKPLDGLTLTTGSKPFIESYIHAELLALELGNAGATVDNRPNMGSTILFDALRSNTVDCYVDYSGTIWATIMKREEPASRLETLIEAAGYLLREHGVTTVGPLGYRNDYCFAMRRGRTAALGIRSIADLAGRNLKIAGDPEVFGRPEWRRVREAYGLESLTPVGMQKIYMFEALMNDQVDAIVAYTTDGRIALHDLALLDDPKQVFPPYDAMLLVSPQAAGNAALIDVLSNLVNRIDGALMRGANRAVDVEGQTPEAAAASLWNRLRSPTPAGGE